MCASSCAPRGRSSSAKASASRVTRQLPSSWARPRTRSRDHTVADNIDVIVLGASGHGMVVCDIVMAAGGGLRAVGFVDANPALHDTHVLDLPVFGAVEDLVSRGRARVAMGIGNNAARRRAFARVLELGLEPV